MLITKLNEAGYTYSLKKLDKMNHGEVAFHFESDGTRLPINYKIVKETPQVSEMEINSVENFTKCDVRFLVPAWVPKDELQLYVGETIISGGSFKKTLLDNNNVSYTVSFGNIQAGNESIIKDKPIV